MMTPRTPATPTFQALRSDRPLLIDEGACLPLRSRVGQCRRCADACPATALTVAPEAVTVSDACTGCGRCIPVCPTGALELPELQALPPKVHRPTATAQGEIPEEAPIVRVECRMVAQRRQDDVTVPCAGAVSAGRLLQWVAAGATVQVMDRGWCDGCVAHPSPTPADPGTNTAAPHPAQAAIDTANLWLEACGLAPRVHLVREPLPLAQRPGAIPPAEDPGPTLDRRSFFRHAVERPTGRHRSAQPMGADGRAAHTARTRHPSVERQRQHEALQRLAADAPLGMPAEFYPTLHVDARCCDARMCEALCPTTALTVVDDGAGATLRFDPAHCIACGTCVRACPEGALALTPYGGPAHPQDLIRHELRACRECGERYAPARDAADTGLCVLCRKTHAFIDDARRQLFGAR